MRGKWHEKNGTTIGYDHLHCYWPYKDATLTSLLCNVEVAVTTASTVSIVRLTSKVCSSYIAQKEVCRLCCCKLFSPAKDVAAKAK